MNSLTNLALLMFIFLSAAACQAAPASNYAGQETRAIKALSDQEVSDLLAGKGMGLAKAAELNGYAGPLHVLELADALKLTPEQRAKTQALKDAMTAKAIPLGKALVAAEGALDRLFSSKTITPSLLNTALDEIAALQARVRGTHLETHLAQVLVLTAEQNARYAELRGYTGAASIAPAAGAAHHR